jgi:hypothetical protein
MCRAKRSGKIMIVSNASEPQINVRMVGGLLTPLAMPAADARK